MSNDRRTSLIALGGSAGVLGSHPAPGSHVPWLLLLVAALLVFAAAWGLTVYFERRQKPRPRAPEPHESAR